MSIKSVLAALFIVIAVVLVPLWLKRATAAAPHASTPAPPRTVAGAPATPAPKALPRFVDIGTTSCAPCKVMLGVMQELESRYPDALKVEFINSHDSPDIAEKLNIQAIPTQIFYAPNGQEIFRHTGVMRTDAVVAKWTELGLMLSPAKAAP